MSHTRRASLLLSLAAMMAAGMALIGMGLAATMNASFATFVALTCGSAFFGRQTIWSSSRRNWLRSSGARRPLIWKATRRPSMSSKPTRRSAQANGSNLRRSGMNWLDPGAV